MSVGCLEPKFFAIFLERFLKALPEEYLQEQRKGGGWEPNLERQGNREDWPKMRTFFEEGFKLFGRDYWEKVFEGSDACALPVLTPLEASKLVHANSEPASLIPHPHPRLSRTPFVPIPTKEEDGLKLLKPGQHTDEVLTELGLSEGEKRKLKAEGALGKAKVGAKL